MKKITSIILVLLMLMSFYVPVGAAGAIVESVSVTETGLTISGNAGGFKDNISIFLLRPDVTDEDIENVADGEAIFLLSQYANVVGTDGNGAFTVGIETSIEQGKVYTLKITGTELEETLKITNKGYTVERNELVEFIRFYDDKIIVDGCATEENSDVDLYVFDEALSIYEALADESKLKAKASLLSGEDGAFSAEIPIAFEDSKTYSLYVLQTEANGASYESSIHRVRKPETIYVGEDFATIQAARDYLRTNLKDVPVNVIIKDGDYILTDTLTFTSADARNIDTAVTYRAENPGKASISGAKKLSSLVEVSETDSVYSRIPENARDKVVKVNLIEQGFTSDYLDFIDYYMEHSTELSEDKPITSGKNVVPFTVLLNDSPQKISSYPNSGFAEDAGYVEGYADRMTVNTTLAEKWKNAPDMFIKAYFAYSWAGECSIVRNIDASTGLLTFGYDTSYGVKPLKEEATIRWSANNLAEEMDVPGEWYLNSENGDFYYYPPYTLTESDSLEIAALDKDLISIKDAAFIYFDGWTVCENSPSKYLYNHEPSRNNGFEFLDTEADTNHIRIDNCIIRDIGANGISVYGTNHNNLVFDGLVIYNTGFSGIYLNAGGDTSLIESKSVIRNCDISNPSIYTENNSASCIKIGGCGVLVEHNVLHNSKSIGLRYGGTCHILRYNELYNNTYEQSDSSAIYAGRSWNQYGTVVTKNLIHHTGADSYLGADTMGVYLDDYHGGNTVTGNIFVNNMPNVDYAAIHIGQGPDNVANANTIINAVESTREVTGVTMSYRNITFGTLSEKLETADEAYFERFPSAEKYKGIYAGIDGETSLTTAQKEILKGYKENYEAKNNIGYGFSDVFYHPDATSSGYGKKEWNTVTANHTMTGINENNLQVEDIFVDKASLDYRVKDNSGAPSDVLSESNFKIGLIGVQRSLTKTDALKLVSPLNGANLKETKVTLVWKQAGGYDSYNYEISSDSEFTDIVASGNTKNTFCEVNGLNNDRAYYWRVTALKEGRVKESKTSLVGMFALGNAQYTGTVLGEPELVVTDDSIKVTDNILSLDKESFEVTYILAAEQTDGNIVYKIAERQFSETGVKEITICNLYGKEQFIKYILFRWDNLKNLKPIESFKQY